MAAQAADVGELMKVVQDEFREMPGLRLTRAQFKRLWSMDQSTCDVLIDVLVEKSFLVMRPDGSLCLADARRP
jgi:hypothetical protein